MSQLSQTSLELFSDFLANTMGLYFPKEGWKEFERKMVPAVRAFGFKDISSCVQWLMSAPLTKEQITTLALYLTIGETYFFRDPATFNLLESKILPELIAKRRGKDQYLRIWCAACCSGEEPYSIAMILHKLLGDLSQWNISILGTDINLKFLQLAETALYKEWSFRTTPKTIRERYFQKEKEGKYALSPQIKKMVKFFYLNLVEDYYPSPLNGTNAMDLILCNNVLIYFSHQQINKVVQQLSYSLVTGGWLVVSPIEVPFIKDPLLTSFTFSDKTLFKKEFSQQNNWLREKAESFFSSLKTSSLRQIDHPSHIKVELPAFLHAAVSTIDFDFSSEIALPTSIPIEETPSFLSRLEPKEPKQEALPQPSSESDETVLLFSQANYGKVIEILEKSLTLYQQKTEELKEKSWTVLLLIRAYANQGKLTQAKEWCQKMLAIDKLNPYFYYFYAIILQEQKSDEEAIAAFKKVLYLSPNFIMAHFALGNLMLAKEEKQEAHRHFRNALLLLEKCQMEELLPGAEGMTAGRLIEFIHVLREGKK